jgi:GntR family transcriptional regulator/GntR family frlABCD operon transcriptional regulator
MPEKKNIPRYKLLYEDLRKQIVDGTYNEGDLLPSENELSALYNVTRPTVRQALALLVSDGFIMRQQGKGSIVHKLPKGIGILSIAGTTSALGERNIRSSMLEKPSVQVWPRPFMFSLPPSELRAGCIKLSRIRYFNDTPIFYDINYLPNINLERFTSRNFENKSLFDTLRIAYGIKITGGEQKLRSILADAKLSEYLRLEAGMPVLHLERRFDTSRPGYSIYSSIYCNTAEQAVYGIF